MSFKSFSESNWTPFYEDEYRGIYHNFDTLRIVDNSVFLLEKGLRKKPPKGEIGCYFKYIEFDCKSLMSRSLNEKYYSDPECSFFVHEITKPKDWRYNEPGSRRNKINNQLCDLRNLKK